jgi:hypothetical protein
VRWVGYVWLVLAWGFLAGCLKTIIVDAWIHRNDKKNEGG